MFLKIFLDIFPILKIKPFYNFHYFTCKNVISKNFFQKIFQSKNISPYFFSYNFILKNKLILLTYYSIDEVSTRAKNQIERLMGSIENGVGQDMYRGSKLWLLNGLTTLLHNDTAYKSDEEEFKSILEGDGFKKLNKAYAALELVA